MSRLFYPLLLSAIPATGALCYVFLRTRPGTWNLQASPAHYTSYAQYIVNPRRYATQSDSLTFRIPTSKLHGLQDEEILARFTRGFFGRWAFFLEGKFFKWTDYRISRLDVARGASCKEIWSPGEISTTSLPALGSLLFGNFMVLDSSSATPDECQVMLPGSKRFLQPEGVEGSYVEFGYGKSSGTFSGSHRFEVWREGLKGNEKDDASIREEEEVVVKYNGIRGNPTQDGVFTLTWASGFHKVYAICLFANGVSEILR